MERRDGQGHFVVACATDTMESRGRTQIVRVRPAARPWSGRETGTTPEKESTDTVVEAARAAHGH